MNVASQEISCQETISQEYETHYVEGFLDETPRGRMANYMSAEDKLVVFPSKNMGLEPTVSSEQPKDAFWRRMKEYFDVRNKSGNE
jgi:hypothetical protein